MQFYVVKSVLRPERIFTIIYNMLIRSSSFRGDRAYWNVREGVGVSNHAHTPGVGILKPNTYAYSTFPECPTERAVPIHDET